MSKTSPDLSVNGWPLLTADHYIDAVPLYTQELADKLDNSDADVAAAINAANTAQQHMSDAESHADDAADARDQAIAAVESMPKSFATFTSITFNNQDRVSQYVDFPPGRFTTTPVVVATTHDYLVNIRVTPLNEIRCSVTLWFDTALSVTVGVSLYAVEAH